MDEVSLGSHIIPVALVIPTMSQVGQRDREKGRVSQQQVSVLKKKLLEVTSTHTSLTAPTSRKDSK